MKTKHIPAHPQAADHEAAFLAVKAEIDAIRDDELIPINTDLERSVSITVGASVRLQSLKPGFAKLFFVDPALPDRLAVYAFAALYAHVAATQDKADDTRLPKRLEEAGPLREVLLQTAELLVTVDEFSAEVVGEIRSGTGSLDTANDLVKLARLFDQHWDRVKQRVPITREQVDRARELGHELIGLIGTNRYVPAPLTADNPARTRARAFTLLVRKYDECRRAVVALRWNEGDADVFMPTLHPKKRRRADEDETPETELTPVLEPPVLPEPVMPEVPITA